MKSLTIYIFSLTVFLFGISHIGHAQLSEGFEGTFPPVGWASFDNGVQQDQSWEKSSNNPNTGSAHAFVNFSTSTTEFAEDWLVTPKLLPDGTNNTLTFQATNDFAGNTGSIYTIRVSTTSQTDKLSFTTELTLTEADFTPDVYQVFNVNLSAYIGQEIYVAFVLENSKGDSFILDDVSGPPTATVGTVPNCDAALIVPDPKTWNDVPLNSQLGWSSASGDPTGYKIQIGTSQGGAEFLTLTDIGTVTSYQPATEFAPNTRYYVTIVAYNSSR